MMIHALYGWPYTMDEAELLSNRIAILANGKLRAIDTPQGLRAGPRRCCSPHRMRPFKFRKEGPHACC